MNGVLLILPFDLFANVYIVAYVVGQFPFAKCFICGQVGHLSRSCPDNPRGLYPNGMLQCVNMICM